MEMIYQPQNLKEALPARSADSHKGTYGKVLVIAGSRNMSGAAYLAAKAAYRTGAGLVFIYTPECNRVILQQQLPEAVLLTYEPDAWKEEELRDAITRMDALVAGPGLCTREVSRQILEVVLQADAIPRILDADALNLLAAHPKLWSLSKTPFIITPHVLEMARLSGQPAEAVKAKKAESAQRFSAEHHVITVLKDAKTVTSDGKDCFWNSTGNHGMATGGSGDVLAGVIGGLLAQGMELLEAAKLGVYLHGLAGDAARKERGAYAMMAGDIAEHILWKVDTES